MSRHIYTRLDKKLIFQILKPWLSKSPPIGRLSRSSLNFNLPYSTERSLSSLLLIHNLLGLSHENYMHMSSTANREIEYDDLLKLRKSGLTVIDVRGSDEIKASGSVPGSFNIPSQQIESALKKHPDEFVSMYGRPKPNENDTILFYCQRGVRSKKAMEKAIQLGFINSVSLKGGWEEFSKHSK